MYVSANPILTCTYVCICIMTLYLLLFLLFGIRSAAVCYKVKKPSQGRNLFFPSRFLTRKNIDHKSHIDNKGIDDRACVEENVEKTIKSKIGVEVHVQLSTKHKAFCNCFNVASLYKEKTYEKNNIDLIRFLNENILRKGTKSGVKFDVTGRGEVTAEGGTNDANIELLFESCSDAVNTPNKHICNVCVGEVGSLNLLNSTAVLFTYLICIILNCSLSSFITFDRKIYNYYDLPKGYQITQREKPLGTNGYIYVEGKKFCVRSVHLEEDTSKCYLLDKSTDGNDAKDSYSEGCREILTSHRKEGHRHTSYNFYEKENCTSNGSEKQAFGDTGERGKLSLSHNLDETNKWSKKILLDYNRCGIPLAEIVVEEDYMNVEDCINLLREIKNKVCLLGVCVGNKENIRSDINISFEYNNIKCNRVEIKNINSFTKIRNCIQMEKKNFVKMIMENDNTKKINHRTLGNVYTKSYLDNIHYVLRKKEDYNYVHESNIPEYKLRNNILKLLKFYVNYKIKIYDDEMKYKWSKHYFHVFFNDPFLYNYFNKCLKYEQEKSVSNFLVNTLLDILKKKNVLSKNILIKPKDMCFLINCSEKKNLDKTFLRNFLYKFVDVGFDREALLDNIINFNAKEMEDMLKQLIDDNLKHLKVDCHKNLLNEQNFKNRIIGLLKRKMKQKNGMPNINYEFVDSFIADYVKKSI
ncbi:glutamyl-tRNA(Gln) amidotransferase subunit B, putative [Plasmodium ovale]|uniref:Glutamyl-tRNA(Gln) amidotransferase subunit B, putative n=1 Tax=Plasmodium ovale TaxID=36330 RepID=A0A1D3TJ57_PLAOA|nr:glutamyl-tRNA(Gln) amidotransferase subunit B, putative [Plasmodium ovale]